MNKIVFLIKSLILVLLVNQNLFGQDINEVLSVHREYEPFVIPKTPIAQALEQYGNLGANTAKGTLDIRVPIFSLEIDGLNLPIELVYNSSGVRVNDLPTIVGQNWNLIADGRISRNIVGQADENSSSGYFYMNDTERPSLDWNNITDCSSKNTLFESLQNNYIDCSPDNFNYNFAGYSGEFVFSRETDGSLSIKKLTTDLLNIKSYSELSTFTVHDGVGNTFEFGGDSYIEESINDSYTEMSTGSSAPNAPITDGKTGWMLKRIVTKNSQEVLFYYSKTNVTYSILSSEQYVYSPLSVDEITNSNCGPMDSHSKTYSVYDYEMCLPDSIVTPTHAVIFNYETNSNSLLKKRLKSIVIDSRVGWNKFPLKKFTLYYSDWNRPLLTGVEEAIEGRSLYHFTYYGYLPPIGSLAQDFFGYYNGQTGNTSLVPFIYRSSIENSQGNRYVCPNNIINGAMESITYPTGGKTQIYYEPNFSVQDGYAIFAPGIRVKRTEDYNIDDSLIRNKTYFYDSLSTTDAISAQNYFSGFTNHVYFDGSNYMGTGNIMTYTSNDIIPSYNPNMCRGSFYRKVAIVEDIKEPVLSSVDLPCAMACSSFSNIRVFVLSDFAKNGWIEESYRGYAKGSHIEPMLVNKTTFNSSNEKVEQVENTYGFDNVLVSTMYIPKIESYSLFECSSQDVAFTSGSVGNTACLHPWYRLEHSDKYRNDIYLQSSRKKNMPVLILCRMMIHWLLK